MKLTMKQIVFATFVAMMSSVASAAQITEGLSNTQAVIYGVIAVLIAGAALVGLWFTFTGIMGMVNKSNGQDTPAMSLGKTIGGLVLMSVMAFAGALLTEFGIEENTNSAINQNAFGTQG